MDMLASLITVSDEYARITQRSRARVSTLVFNQGGRLDDFASGRKSPTLRTLQSAMLWFSRNWPEGCSWPDGIARPEVLEAQP